MPMDAGNKYFGSAWRRDAAGCPGSFLMDSSVHFIAALRMLAAAAGCGPAVAASALARSARPAELPGPDTLVGVVAFGPERVPASVSISLAAATVRWSLQVSGTAGTMEVSRGGWGGARGSYSLSFAAAAGGAAPTTEAFAFSGVEDELAAFSAIIAAYRSGGDAGVAAATPAIEAAAGEGAVARAGAGSGLADLAVVEALLASAAAGGAPVAVADTPV
jgi:predicted dehydrogenase